MRCVAAAIFLAVAAVSPICGQQIARASVPAIRPATDTLPPLRPSITVSANPNSIRVIAVPVPAELHAEGGAYALERLNGFAILSRVAGLLPSSGSGQPVTITVAIPAAAPAGPVTIGVLRFTCQRACGSIDVPIVVDVRERRSLHVVADRPLVSSAGGARIRIDVTVTNTGNTGEDATLSADVPPGWRTRVLTPQPIRIAAGRSAAARFELTPEPNFSAGDYGVLIRVSGAGEPATTAVTVRIDAETDLTARAYPILSTTAALAYVGDGSVTPAFGADLSARIFDGFLLTGRGTMMLESASASSAQRSLGRLGYSPANGTLSLRGRGLEAAAGNVGASSTGLFGAGLWGTGASARWSSEQWRAGGQAIKPNRGEGRYLVVEGARRTGSVWTGFAAADLQEAGSGPARAARVLAADFGLPWDGGGAQFQAGFRRSGTDTGAGWLGRIEHRSADWGVNALASHAPGGAQTFARAQDELQLDGYRRFGQVSLSGGGWSSRDARAGENFGSTGWSAASQLALAGAGTFTTRIRGSNWSWDRGNSEFTNEETEAGISWDGAIGGVQASANVAHALLDRTSALDPELQLDASARRTTAGVAAGGSARFGAWHMDLLVERTGAGVGLPERQLTVGARIDQVPILAGRIYAHAELLTHRLGASGLGRTSQSAGLEFRIDAANRIVIDAERNGIASSGQSPWVISAQVGRILTLPFQTEGGRSGTVFEDRNGDGNRDRGENGVPGAVVRIDGRSVTADQHGRFRIGTAVPGHIDVDPRSLPAGLMAAPHPATAVRTDLAVVPTQPLDFLIKLPTRPATDSTHIRVEAAVIVLTDSAGRRWTGSPDAAGKLRFGSLRPGVYVISADLSQIGEPLVLPESLPTVRVDGTTHARTIELLLTARPLRMRGTDTVIRKVSGGGAPQ